MNAVDDSGQEPEQHIPPTIDAGCEIEIDRSVPGTVDSTGSAEFEQWLIKQQQEAEEWFWRFDEGTEDEKIALNLSLAFSEAIDERSS